MPTQAQRQSAPQPHLPHYSPPVSSPLASAQAQTRHRPAFTRAPTTPALGQQFTTASLDEEDVGSTPRTSVSGNGLGISDLPVSKTARVSVQPVMETPPAVESAAGEQPTPDSSAPLMSSPGPSSGSTRFPSTMNSPYYETDYSPSKHSAKHSMGSLHSTRQPSVYAPSDAGLLSVRERYDEYEPHHNCRSHTHFKQKIGSCISTAILFTSVLSVVLSGLFLGTALAGPRYGRTINTHGTITASTAAFLTSLLAKIIEIAFGTAVVAFLGQALGRRAFNLERPAGVTLAEISMRNWIMSPGTIFTNWSSVRYAGNTVLGVISLLAAVAALLYTSAATALVQPQLKYPNWSPRVLQGLVKTSFANTLYMSTNCQTPILQTYDPVDGGNTCIQIEHAAMGYHNYFGFLSAWTNLVRNGTGSADPTQRPKGHAVFNDNTTVIAPWVDLEYSNVTLLSNVTTGILINNVSMAIPHPGVFQAAVDPLNADVILQPDDLDGIGSYNIRASVPSPVIHVLCATLNRAQLEPVVFEAWPGADGSVTDMTRWPKQLDDQWGSTDHLFLNESTLHPIFKWGPQYGSYNWPPVFPKFPNDFNTIVNDTVNIGYGRTTIYVLAKGGPIDSFNAPTNVSTNENYALCQLQASLTPFCATHYNASSSGGTLEAVCEDNNELQYNNSLPLAQWGNDTLNKEWPNVASEWASSLSLNDGVIDGNSSNARILTQLILTKGWADPKLNVALPSMAEGLAVLAGCTLLSSAQDSPFTEFYNYSSPVLLNGQYQYFNASVRAQQYASGGTANYQKAFFLPLFLVFFLSIFILIYFVSHREWYTDFAEPSNLFSLAVQSPPSKEFGGSCGGGPRGEHYRVSWKLSHVGDHVFMESQDGVERTRLGRQMTEGWEMMMSPVKRASGIMMSPVLKRNSETRGGTFEMISPRET